LPIQESALYGDPVLYLRDRAAELQANGEGDLEDERERLDCTIHDWFFTPEAITVALESGEDPSWHRYYDDGGIIASYS